MHTLFGYRPRVIENNIMLLFPKRTKFRKTFKGKIRGIKVPKKPVAFGVYGLRVIEHGQVTARAIEAARRAISRALNRAGTIFMPIFPQTPVTRKPNEVRMGRGKGSVDHWAAKVFPGSVIFEVSGVKEELARKSLKLAAAKLPVKTRFVQESPVAQNMKASAH